MSKRFTDTDKWKKSFIKGLSPKHKLLWLYILDECDHAGVWHKEIEIASVRLGVELDEKNVREIFADHIIEFDNKEKWFIPDFIEFQYGELNPENRAHKSVIDRLKKYDLMDDNGKKPKPLTSPLQAPKNGAKDKDKDKEQDMDQDKRGECEGGKYSIESRKKWDEKQPIDYASFVDYWNEYHDTQLQITDNKKGDIKKQLKHFTGYQIQTAIYHRKIALKDSEYLNSWESLFTRKIERMEKYLNLEVENARRNRGSIQKTRGDKQKEQFFTG